MNGKFEGFVIVSIFDLVAKHRVRTAIIGGAGVAVLLALALFVLSRSDSSIDDTAHATTTRLDTETGSTSSTSTTVVTDANLTSAPNPSTTISTLTTMGDAATPLLAGMPIACEKLTGPQVSKTTKLKAGAGRLKFNGYSICEYLNIDSDFNRIALLKVFNKRDAQAAIRVSLQAPLPESVWSRVEGVGEDLVVDSGLGRAWIVNGDWGFYFEQVPLSQSFSKEQLTELMKAIEA